MKLMIELLIACLIVAVIYGVVAVVYEKTCTHICPKKKECCKMEKDGKLPPCITDKKY